MCDLTDPLHRFNPAATVTKVKPGTVPTFYECGICGALHNARWNGDCRQDNARFNADDLDARYGIGGWEEIDMDGVDDWARQKADSEHSGDKPGDDE